MFTLTARWHCWRALSLGATAILAVLNGPSLAVEGCGAVDARVDAGGERSENGQEWTSLEVDVG